MATQLVCRVCNVIFLTPTSVRIKDSVCPKCENPLFRYTSKRDYGKDVELVGGFTLHKNPGILVHNKK